MALKVYNTLSRKKEKFIPLKKGRVDMYVCGVTVYDDCHLGHARAYLAFDVICRYLEHKGYKVNYVQNFTDIDDKIINRARSELRSIHSPQSIIAHRQGTNGQSIEWTESQSVKVSEGQKAVNRKDGYLKEKVKEISQRYIKEYYEVMGRLNIKRAGKYPRATGNMPGIIGMIESLVDKGFAYEAGGSVYFQVDKFKNYGCLSRRGRNEMTNISRLEKDKNKRNPLDFVLWKKSKPDEPSWASPWGKGRPGWHIECSVMSQKYLGETLDIHGGGSDLIFPHHENEIAQSEAYTGKTFVRYWLHNGFVTINKEKMSKSLGNIFTLKDLFEKYPPEVVRLFLISTHYRNPIDFSPEGLEDTWLKWRRINKCLHKIDLQGINIQKRPPKKRIRHSELKNFISRFENYMDDDFNTAGALGVVFELVGLINKEFERDKIDKEFRTLTYQMLGKFLEVLGLPKQVQFYDEYSNLNGRLTVYRPDAEIENLIKERNKARLAKEWGLADKIRQDLKKRGIILEDSQKGTKWRKI